MPYSKLGATPSNSPSAGAPGGIAVADICLRVMEPRLHTLRWKRATPALIGLLNKHFTTGKDKFVNGDIAQVQQILSGVHFYQTRFNAFGIMPVEKRNPGRVIARTVRGGAKVSTKQVQISIWLTACLPISRVSQSTGG